MGAITMLDIDLMDETNTLTTDLIELVEKVLQSAAVQQSVKEGSEAKC